MTNLRRRYLTFCSLWLGTLLCVLALATVGSLYLLPLRAAQTFGPPAENHTPVQLAVLSFRLILFENELHTAPDPDGPAVQFRIEFGEPASAAIDRLAQAGLIENPAAFTTYLRYKGMDTSIQAGEYTLTPAMNAIIIADLLQDATPTHVTFAILAGWRLEEIAAALPTSGLSFSPQSFLAAASRLDGEYSFLSSSPADASLEGFFSPGVYQIPRDSDVQEFIDIILTRFEQNLSPDVWQGFSRQGLAVYEAVTLASIVEREAVDEAEMPLIASVFHNRLAANMKLDSDPTVQYAVGFNPDQNSWWTNPLSRENLGIDSPYNTYLYPGLPPGPIANPGANALRAIAFPAETPYFYFRAGCDGTGRHVFATTYEEHVNNACP